MKPNWKEQEKIGKRNSRTDTPIGVSMVVSPKKGVTYWVLWLLMVISGTVLTGLIILILLRWLL
jgi:hypothetical protein